jgi:DNA polymerase-3 subunit beta
MKAVIDTELLKQSLNTVSRFIPRSSRLPILQGIKIEADELGITLSGTSLEIGAMLMIPATIEDNGVIIAPGQKLTALMNLIDTETVTIKSLPNERMLLTTVNNGNSSHYKLNVYDKDEFPPMPVMPDKLCQMSGKQLAYLLSTGCTGISKGTGILPFGLTLKDLC